MLAYQEWEEWYDEGKLNEAQKQFFEERTPEALYDIENDPHEVSNLAADPAFQEVLEELRVELQNQVKSMPDLSFFPESYFVANGIENPVQFGQENQAKIQSYIKTADLSLLPFAKAKKGIKKALKSNDPWIRYWGLIVCSSFGDDASIFYKKSSSACR